MNSICEEILRKLEMQDKIKVWWDYTSPKKQELKLRLKDLLDDEVDESYYLTDIQVDKIVNSTFTQKRENIQDDDVCSTLLARDWKDPKCVRVGGIFDTETTTHQAGSVYDANGISPTINTCEGGYREPSIIQVGNLQGGKWDKINESCRRVYSEDGVSPTITTCQGGNTEPKIITHNIVQKVKVRKYPVNTEKLVEVLRDAKSNLSLSNREIAIQLNLPITTIEHYFRTDDSFAIPEPEVWSDLKELLQITTDEFDTCITEFEERDGVYEKSNRVYDEKGLAPTLTQQEEKVAIFYNDQYVDLPAACASRGRNPENPSDRTPGTPTTQRLEVNTQGTSNCITTVEKDNYVIVSNTEKDIDNPLKGISGQSWQFEQNVYSEDSKCVRTIKAGEGSGNIPKVIEDSTEDNGGIGSCNAPKVYNQIAIRKLTPKECWRLMGFDDEDYDKAAKVNSKTQLYKQAGNAIVVNVLEAILDSIFNPDTNAVKPTRPKRLF
jgi:site-specific DNA-cytosine methylase